MSSWSYHPSGVYKNRALSSRLLYNALARTIFPRFMEPEKGFGKKRGESVTITRALQLAVASRISSDIETIPEVNPEQSTVSGTVSLWGLKINTTEFEETLTHYDLRSKNQRLLRNNIQLTLDYLGAETLVSTPIKFIPTSGGGSWDTDGTASTQATANMTIDQLKTIRRYMSGTLKTPPFDNGKYVGVFTTQGMGGILDDSDAATWLAPTSSTAFRRGTVGADSPIPGGTTPMAQFVGTIDNVDLYEVNNLDVFEENLGNSNQMGEGVVFGADAMFLAQAMAPELRVGLSTDLGTKREVGWVGIFDAGLCWPEAELARVVHVTSMG